MWRKLCRNSIILGYCGQQLCRKPVAYLLPPATKLGQGYVFTGVCHSVNGGGEFLTRYTPPGPGTPPWTRYTPQTRYTPPGPGTPPWGQVHPPGARYTLPPGTRYTPRTRYTPPQSMLGDTVNARAVHILLECNLVTSLNGEDWLIIF